jgi:hypothetical protein
MELAHSASSHSKATSVPNLFSVVNWGFLVVFLGVFWGARVESDANWRRNGAIWPQESVQFSFDNDGPGVRGFVLVMVISRARSRVPLIIGETVVRNL